MNEAFRSHLSSLTRRGRTLPHNGERLTPQVYVVGCVHNFCPLYQSLRLHYWGGVWLSLGAMNTRDGGWSADHGWEGKELLL